MKLNLQVCTLSDWSTLLQVSRETFASTFEKDNDPKDFKQYMDSAFTEEAIKTQLQNTASKFYFVFSEEILVGYLKLNFLGAQTDVHDDKAMELERIYVLEQYQGKRIGQWMLEQVIQMAKSREDITYLWLGVWEKNIRAIYFYEKNGFKKFSAHSFFIGKDEQTDWLMRLDF